MADVSCNILLEWEQIFKIYNQKNGELVKNKFK